LETGPKFDPKIKMSGPSFEFIAQDPNERFSEETQTTIRKQAMRAVGAARRRSGRASRSTRATQDTSLPRPYSMPLSGLEMLVRDRGIDPIDLSALTSIHIGAMCVNPLPIPNILIQKILTENTIIAPRQSSEQSRTGFLKSCHVGSALTFRLFPRALDTH
jgi:hypothetical protein